jgi:DNA repair protein RadC
MENQHAHVSEIQLSYSLRIKPSQLPKITHSRDAYQILKNSWDFNKIELVEQFKVMLLNRANKVLGICEVSSGGTASTVADPKIIFGVALKGMASGIIVSHNHPSGNLKPSQADIDLTRKLKEAGKFLELQLLDHVIISSEGFYSFTDEGLI